VDLFVLILFPVAWWGVGQAVDRRLDLEDGVLGEHILAFGVGVLVHSLLMTVTLLAGVPALLTTLLFLAVGILFAVAYRRDAAAALGVAREWFLDLLWPDRLLALLLAGFLALLLGSAFGPPYEYDALAYHLPEVRHYCENDTLRPVPFLKETFYPKSITVLFVSGTSLGTWSACRVIHALLGILLVAGVGRIALLLGRDRWAFVAMLAFLSIRETNYVFASSVVDIGFGFLQVMTAAQVVEAVVRRRLRSAVLAGAFGGLSVAAKFLGAGLLLFGGVALFVSFAVRREWRSAILFSVLCGVTALTVYGPWFARNQRYLGEALHPLRPARIERLGPSEGVVPETATGRIAAIARGYSVRETPILLSLAALTLEPPRFRHPLNPVYLGFLPVGLLALFLARNRNRRLLLFTGLALAAYWFWFKTYPHVRYAQGPFAILAVGVAAGLAFLTGGGRVTRVLASLALAAFIFMGLAKGAVDAAYSWTGALSIRDREEYLASRIDPYEFHRRVLRESTGRVVSNDDRIFYLGERGVPVSFRNSFWRKEMTPGQFLAWLSDHDLGYVAVFARHSVWGEMGPACRRLVASGRMEVVFDDPDGVLYRVVRR